MSSPSTHGSADNTYLDLDYSGYHKNFIQLLFIIMSFVCGPVSHTVSNTCMLYELGGVTWNFLKVRTIIFQIHPTRLPNRFPPCLLPNILKLRASAWSWSPNAQKHGLVLSSVFKGFGKHVSSQVIGRKGKREGDWGERVGDACWKNPLMFISLSFSPPLHKTWN